MRRRFTNLCVLHAIGAAMVIASPAQTFTTLAEFNLANGARPYGALVQGLDGNLYGTTGLGGLNNNGTVFKITPNGGLTTSYNFSGIDGDFPYAGLTMGPNGEFYGTTELGGAANRGTVFSITPGGTLTSLYSFCIQPLCADGGNPYDPVVRAANGSLYGTANSGGQYNAGTVFALQPDGALTTLTSFTNGGGGAFPQGGLVQGYGGDFYGTTSGNTVFKISPGGLLTTLAALGGSTYPYGADPKDGLVLASDGNFYGTTSAGGNVIYCSYGCGTIFKVTPQGALTTLYSFSPSPDGELPYAPLIQATDGNLYGTAANGGVNGGGTIFSISLEGKLTALYSFASNGNSHPYGALTQGTDGSFYGVTSDFERPSAGSIFRLSVGLSPFVTTLPGFGQVGATVKILGTRLTGTTSVAFDGTAAAFTVVSRTLITATVPPGAGNGTVQVTTPDGTLLSNLPFRVIH
jgi:uncharacterized repeat protein (TIGR03803 family)